MLHRRHVLRALAAIGSVAPLTGRAATIAPGEHAQSFSAIVRKRVAIAAIAPICGAGDSDRAERIRHLPVWAFHGALDTAVPIAGDQEMVDALKAVGGKVRFTVYPDVGHNAWDRAYADPALYEWLTAQRRSSSR